MLKGLDEMLEHLGDKRVLKHRFHRGEGPDLKPGSYPLPEPPLPEPPDAAPVPDGIFN